LKCLLREAAIFQQDAEKGMTSAVATWLKKTK